MFRFSIPALTVAFIATACGGDDDTNNANNTNNQTGNLQQEAVDSGQISFSDGAGLMVMDTLAIDLSGTDIGAPSTPLPSGFDDADFHGAVDPGAATPWWMGWTVLDSAIDGGLPATGGAFHPLQAEIEGSTITPSMDNLCTTVNADFADGGTVTIFGAEFPVCVISQDIEVDGTVSLPNNHVWVLDGTITVGTGDEQLMGGQASVSTVLEIEAGTQIFGVQDTASSLVISRGSQIMANGTAEMPILMAAVDVDTSAANVITGDPTDVSGRGTWGGLVLSGFGMENAGDENGELTTEAAPTNAERWFGGMNNSDSSGMARYVIIAESGFAFRQDEEVQGLTLEAVGSGTTLEYFQILGSEDDCVEWFGGAAGMKYLVCNGVDDDGLDIDEGYQGNIQFAIVRIGSGNGNHGIESDGNGDNFDQMPFTAPNIANLTVLGNVGKQDSDTRGTLHREGFRGKVYRSVFTDDLAAGGAFTDGCLDVDDVLPDELEHNDSVFNCSPMNLAVEDD